MTKKQKKVLIRIIIAFLLLVVLHFVPVKGWLSLVLYLVPYFVIGYDILKKGSETAKHEAEKTLAEVKHAMKIDYFDTPEFLEEQVEKFK